jgi:hypothetical protein
VKIEYCLGEGSLIESLRTVKQTRLTRRSVLALGTGWFFVLLLASSAPHRVHHAFEDLGFSQKSSADAATRSEGYTHLDENSEHDADGHEHDHSSGGSAKADCVVQAVAQNFHLAPAQATEFSYLELQSETQPAVTLARHYQFSLSPFSQRAPPQA